MSAQITQTQRSSLTALVDTFVPRVAVPEDRTGFWAYRASDAGVHGAIEQMLSAQLPEPARLGLPQLLDALAGAGLSTSPQEVREGILTAVAASSAEAAAGLRALQGLTLMLAYGLPGTADRRNPSWAETGYPGPRSALPPVPKSIAPLAPEGDVTLEADVCVVGSGAGGGVIAGMLAEAGRRVVVLEAGGYFNEADFAQLELLAYQDMFYRGGLVPTADGTVTMLAGATLGGGTTINWSNAVRLPSWVRTEWARDFGLAGLDTADFDCHLDAVSARISVTDRCSDYNGPNQRLAEGCAALGYPLDRAFRNADPGRYDLDSAGFVGFGDQSGSKQSTLRTYLQDAYDAGARIIVRCHADRVLVEDGRATGVEATHLGEDRRARLVVRCPHVVVAGGALESPALLLRSGIGGPAVGRHLRLHPASAVFGVYDAEQGSWWAAPQTSMCRQFANRGDGYGFLLECMQYGPGFLAAVVPWRSGRDHKELVAKLRHTAPIICLLRDHGSGRVTLDARGEAVPTYRVVDELDRANLADAMVELVCVHVAAGAQEVYTPAYFLPRWRRGQDLQGFLDTVRAIPPDPTGQPVFSAHQLGTCRMGPDPRTSVAGPRGELHDVRGVWIGDGSAVPTAPGVNPMLTIMALARRTAEHVVAATAKADAAAGRSTAAG